MTEDINRLFRSAVEAHDSGRGDEALELYVTVLQRAPQHVQATFRLAMLVSQAGRADEAAWLLEKAIELEPRNGEFRFRFGQVLARYPGDDLSRLEAGLRNLGSPSKPAWKGRTDNVDAKLVRHYSIFRTYRTRRGSRVTSSSGRNTSNRQPQSFTTSWRGCLPVKRNSRPIAPRRILRM